MQTKQIIWNTKTVNETINRMRQGIFTDIGCFYERNPELKAANIMFQLTNEEVEEFNKCSDNAEYFVEKYCRFMTDHGRITVELYPFQRDVLSTLAEEIWINELKDFGPKIRSEIILSSRQSGKCQLFNTKLIIKNTLNGDIVETTIGELYDIVNKQFKKTLKYRIIYRIKKLLYKFYQNLS
jgi:hypothetical protein